MIHIDLDARTLHIDLTDEALNARLAAKPPHTPEINSRWLRRYAKLVSSASTGAVFLD
jgi:dihydroxy-acid dehydratase